MISNEIAAYAAKYGKLTPMLAEALSSNVGDDALPVVVVFHDPDTDPPPAAELSIDSDSYNRLSPQEKKTITDTEVARQKETDSYLTTRAKRILTPRAERLSLLGSDISPDAYFLQIYAKLRGDAIREVSTWDDVRMIDLDSPPKLELNVSRRAIGANLVESQGFDGSGVKVGIVEPGPGSRVETNNPFLAGTFQDSSTVCATPSEHTTAVAGIIRSTDTTGRGISPGASLWAGGSCGGVWTELRDRSHGAAD